MADLKESAEKFIQDLIAQNMAGLMGAFTPEGMSKAMAMGQQGAQGGPPSRTEVNVLEASGEDHPVDLVMENSEGEAIIGTVWRDVGGTWKVHDIEIKKRP